MLGAMLGPAPNILKWAAKREFNPRPELFSPRASDTVSRVGNPATPTGNGKGYGFFHSSPSSSSSTAGLGSGGMPSVSRNSGVKTISSVLM